MIFSLVVAGWYSTQHELFFISCVYIYIGDVKELDTQSIIQS